MKKTVFTSGEVAEICGVSADTVSRWFDLRQIEGYRLGPGGDRRIPYESLKKFMITHGIPLDRFETGRQRILIVDDDPYYLDFISAALSHLPDYEVLTASTGFDTGALIIERNPHLIILDVHLSDMDGRVVCDRVKSRPETQRARVLAVSGHLDDTAAGQLPAHGFDGFLRKPFTAAELTESVGRLLQAPDTKPPRSRRQPTL